MLLGIVLLLVAACGAEEGADGATATPDAGGGSDTGGDVLVIGNVDASNPAEKIEEFQPLADYLAANLESMGISEGTVRIAKDTEEMASLMEAGEVDIYIDAAIPSMEVCEAVGCEFALRQWKGGTAELAGVFVTKADSGMESLQDLTGKIIMLEQPHSTVGHILPLVTLAQQGIAYREVADAEAEVGADEVGYFVSPGGQTSTNMLLNGEIAALAFGERSFKQFSPDVQEQLMILERTVAAPSQLVAFSPAVSAELRDEVVRLMVELTESDEGLAILESLRETEKFEAMPDDLAAELDALYETVKQTLGE
jgi:phosphonate transport system substrate-binding protein